MRAVGGTCPSSVRAIARLSFSENKRVWPPAPSERRESGDNVLADLDAYVREVEANSGMANMLRQ